MHCQHFLTALDLWGHRVLLGAHFVWNRWLSWHTGLTPTMLCLMSQFDLHETWSILVDAFCFAFFKGHTNLQVLQHGCLMTNHSGWNILLTTLDNHCFHISNAVVSFFSFWKQPSCLWQQKRMLPHQKCLLVSSFWWLTKCTQKLAPHWRMWHQETHWCLCGGGISVAGPTMLLLLLVLASATGHVLTTVATFSGSKTTNLEGTEF